MLLVTPGSKFINAVFHNRSNHVELFLPANKVKFFVTKYTVCLIVNIRF